MRKDGLLGLAQDDKPHRETVRVYLDVLPFALDNTPIAEAEVLLGRLIEQQTGHRETITRVDDYTEERLRLLRLYDTDEWAYVLASALVASPSALGALADRSPWAEWSTRFVFVRYGFQTQTLLHTSPGLTISPDKVDEIIGAQFKTGDLDSYLVVLDPKSQNPQHKVYWLCCNRCMVDGPRAALQATAQ